MDDYTPGLLKQVQMMRGACEDSNVLFHIRAVTALTLDSYVPTVLDNTTRREAGFNRPIRLHATGMNHSFQELSKKRPGSTRLIIQLDCFHTEP